MSRRNGSVHEKTVKNSKLSDSQVMTFLSVASEMVKKINTIFMGISFLGWFFWVDALG